MSQPDVSMFIVVAPSTKGKAVEWAEQRLLSHLEIHFPFFTFMIEPFGPLSDEDEFTVVPIMNAQSTDADPKDDLMIMCRLDPNAIPEIEQVLRSFDLAPASAN